MVMPAMCAVKISQIMKINTAAMVHITHIYGIHIRVFTPVRFVVRHFMSIIGFG